MKQFKRKIFFILFLLTFSLTLFAQQTLDDIEKMYVKKEYRIPMRDGIKLFTAVYSPRDTSQKYPILLWRTPYSVGPYGKGKFTRRLLTYLHFVKEGYIIVFQDVRGKFMSGGEYVNMRPYIENKKPGETDESTDTYDTVDWLIKHVKHNNGRVGLWGISYPGFYAAMATMANHPAIKAISPQAPIANWFVDDDMHHNGALSLPLTFNFFKIFGQPRDSLTDHWPKIPAYPVMDAYTFFLKMGSLKNVNKKYFHGKIKFWNEITRHGTYDKFWKKRNTLTHFKNVRAAVMTVGGWFDSEDLFGAINTYHAIEKKNPGIFNVIVMGPWTHGAWARGEVKSFGLLKFNQNTSEYYRKNIELPFFNYFLKGKGNPNLPEALVYETGTNKWRRFNSWPPEEGIKYKIFFDVNKSLSINVAPKNKKELYDEYLSDPNKPVPYTAKIYDSRALYNRQYVIEDQRFASRRPDVLAYQTKPLVKDITIAGPINVDLFVSTTGTDADWVVKIIDVFPAEKKEGRGYGSKTVIGNYQMLVREDIMRGKFRNSYENPEPFLPGKITEVKFKLQDILHTFKKGHRIMIQVQSSFFPFFDRNPQTFTDIYNAEESSFKKAWNRIYHSSKHPSHISFEEISE